MTLAVDRLKAPPQDPFFSETPALPALHQVIAGMGASILLSDKPATLRGERQLSSLRVMGQWPDSWSRTRRFGVIGQSGISAVIDMWHAMPAPSRRHDPGLPIEERHDALRHARDVGVEVILIEGDRKRVAVLDALTGAGTYRELDQGALMAEGDAAAAQALVQEVLTAYLAVPIGSLATDVLI